MIEIKRMGDGVVDDEAQFAFLDYSVLIVVGRAER